MQQAALMAAAQGTAYINPMAALTHATLNGMANSVVPPTSGDYFLFAGMDFYE